MPSWRSRADFTIRLLSDIQAIFGAFETDKLLSRQLVEPINACCPYCARERPKSWSWPDYAGFPSQSCVAKCDLWILLKNLSDQKETVENTTKILHPLRKSRSYRILERRFFRGSAPLLIISKNRGFFSRIICDRTTPPKRLPRRNVLKNRPFFILQLGII